MIAALLIGLVALIHVYIVILEVVWWDTPRGHKAFGLTPDFAARTKVLAANQGLYNGFLVAGLIWGLWLGPEGFAIKLFFLACVLIAGCSARRPPAARSSTSRPCPPHWPSQPCWPGYERPQPRATTRTRTNIAMKPTA